MILTIKTDKPHAELYLLKENGKILDSYIWEANRELAHQLNATIQKFLKKNKLELSKLTAIGIFTGSGSFTGLRIGTTVANSIAYSYKIPIVSSESENWLEVISSKLKQGINEKIVKPKYAQEPNISKPKPIK